MSILIAPVLWLVDAFRAGMQRRRRVKVLVHRAAFLNGGDEHIFVKVTNLSLQREVEVTNVWFATRPEVDVVNPATPLPTRLRVDETWETWLSATQLPDIAQIERLARVQLSSGTVLRSRPNRRVRPVGFVAAASQPVTGTNGHVSRPPAPALVERWRHSSSQLDALALSHLDSVSMPGVRQTADPGPFFRVGVEIACGPLPDGTTSSALASAFTGFLAAGAVAALLEELAIARPGVTWSRGAGNGLLHVDAIFGPPDSQDAAAAAIFEPAGNQGYGRDPATGRLQLHLEPRDEAGAPAPAADLATWLYRFERALLLPAAMKDFLHELGVSTTSEPAAKVAVVLRARRCLRELVDVGDLPVLPGAGVAAHFVSYAVADPSGHLAVYTGADMLSQLCDHSLHLGDFEPVIARLLADQSPST